MPKSTNKLSLKHNSFERSTWSSMVLSLEGTAWRMMLLVNKSLWKSLLLLTKDIALVCLVQDSLWKEKTRNKTESVIQTVNRPVLCLILCSSTLCHFLCFSKEKHRTEVPSYRAKDKTEAVQSKGPDKTLLCLQTVLFFSFHRLSWTRLQRTRLESRGTVTAVSRERQRQCWEGEKPSAWAVEINHCRTSWRQEGKKRFPFCRWIRQWRIIWEPTWPAQSPIGTLLSLEEVDSSVLPRVFPHVYTLADPALDLDAIADHVTVVAEQEASINLVRGCLIRRDDYLWGWCKKAQPLHFLGQRLVCCKHQAPVAIAKFET